MEKFSDVFFQEFVLKTNEFGVGGKKPTIRQKIAKISPEPFYRIELQTIKNKEKNGKKFRFIMRMFRSYSTFSDEYPVCYTILELPLPL